MFIVSPLTDILNRILKHIKINMLIHLFSILNIKNYRYNYFMLITIKLKCVDKCLDIDHFKSYVFVSII